jgi:hypothetical protein
MVYNLSKSNKKGNAEMTEYTPVTAAVRLEVTDEITIEIGDTFEVAREAYEDRDSVLAARLGSIEFSVEISDIAQ